MKLTGNTVIITGGASGIGMALATALLAKGNTVIVWGRNPAKLEHLRQRYPAIRVARCDVANAAEVQRELDILSRQTPPPNVLVNNAGIQYRYEFATEPDALALIDEEIDINFRAAVRLTRLMLPMLSAAPESAIINISSFLGIAPKRSAPVYCATKAALHAFSTSLRYQLEGSSIKVFDVLTPIVDTDMTRNREADAGKISPDELVRKMLLALGRDRFVIAPGRSGMVLLLNRIAPWLVAAVLKKR